MASGPPIEIRRVIELEDFRKVEELQREVWGFVPMDVVPSRLMRIASKSGTLVLGAFDRTDRLLAFAYGFPGIRENSLVFCSHMLAVHPEGRNRGLGWRLKIAQREWLLERPLDLVTWTFDPLEVKNGYLNLTKLGATSTEYLRNLYGQTSSPLHGGLDTDRFFLQWKIRSPRVVERVQGDFDFRAHCRIWWEKLSIDRVVNATVLGPESLRCCHSRDLDREDLELLVEVPRETGLFRTRWIEEGRIWQENLREIFGAYFAQGYAVTSVLRREDDSGERCFYLVQKNVEGNA